MMAKFLKRLHWALTTLFAILLFFALITKDFMVLANLWFPIWIVLGLSLSLWYVNRSRLEHITRRWKERNKNLGQNIVTPREKDE